MSSEKVAQLVTLTEADLADEEDIVTSAGLLQATRDIYLQRAAFDFSQAFFRVRGYDSSNGLVLLNGISMNKFADGRPQWSNWGGLNDVTRNQEFTLGLKSSKHAFGGLLGINNINTRPSILRPGLRLSSSISNRTYAGRLMTTFNSGKSENGWSYSASGSRRWAKNGFIDGTLYDAYSAYCSLEFDYNDKNTVHLTAILASNRRGRSSAITEEVFDLVGKKYNPYWGIQNGKIRNSRERKIREAMMILNHYHASEKFNLNTGIAYQFGIEARSRLGYYDAPNPDPTYYRYLPSFYLNSPIGANLFNAALAREGFLINPQIFWADLYASNRVRELNGRAAYILYEDIIERDVFSLNSTGRLQFNQALELNFGISFRKTHSKNYARIRDLLDAEMHLDVDPFSNTKNDLKGSLEKVTGDLFNYNYILGAKEIRGFLQVRASKSKWDTSISGNIVATSYFRKGLFLNERYPENSLGESERIQFSNFNLKGGVTYRISGRHWVAAHAMMLNRAPFYQNVYVNPREHNGSVPNIKSEKISSVDVNYYLRLPDLIARVTGFYSRFQRGTDINFFFVDSGLGSDFVQEVLTDLDKLHMGIEMGMKCQISSSVNLTLAASVGRYLYANNPEIQINFDPSDPEIELKANEGKLDLGKANLKNLKLGQGPQKALSFGLEYRDPKYWWIGATANYLAHNYASISSIQRTRSFYLNPESGQAFPEATPENVSKLLRQRKMDDFYLLNITAGKSWRKKGKYISIFANVNNVFDVSYRSGGYEQSRNGNYAQLARDNLSGSPSFAPKYWYGFGRTYFLNLAINF
ncbi:MAG: TonB-dependent receptor, partial [Flavobacteriaceae bacterium]